MTYELFFIHPCVGACTLVFVKAGDNAVPETSDQDAKDGEKKKRLDMVRWMASYQYFAIAAEAAEVWIFVAAMAHLRICLQIGGTCFVSPPLVWKARCDLCVFQSALQQKVGVMPLPKFIMRFAGKSGPSVHTGVSRVDWPLPCIMLCTCL